MSGFLERMLGNLMGGRLGGHGGGYQGVIKAIRRALAQAAAIPANLAPSAAAPMRTEHALPAVRRVLQRGQEFIDLSLRRRPGGLLELYLKQG